MEKPLYTIDLLSSGCNHKLVVNGVVLSESSDGEQLSAVIKINQWLKNGINEVTLEMTPCEGNEYLDSSSIGSLEVRAIDFDDTKSTGTKIESGRSPHFSAPDHSESPVSHTLRMTFSAKLPFGESAFHRSTPFNLEHNSELIMSAFKHIWQLHNEQNWYELIKLEEHKIKELAGCYYEQTNAIRQLDRENFQSSSAEGYQLASFDESCLEIQLLAGGKLATVVDSAGFPAIFYDHPDGTYDLYYYWICQNEQNEVVVIR